jgi:hypothetical protein
MKNIKLILISFLILSCAATAMAMEERIEFTGLGSVRLNQGLEFVSSDEEETSSYGELVLYDCVLNAETAEFISKFPNLKTVFITYDQMGRYTEFMNAMREQCSKVGIHMSSGRSECLD